MKKALMFKFLFLYLLGAVALVMPKPRDIVVALVAGILIFVWSLE